MIRKTLLEKLIILNRADKSGNIAETCRDFGISRISYYHMKKTVGDYIIASRAAPPAEANGDSDGDDGDGDNDGTDIDSDALIARMALAYPDLSNVEISKKLMKDHAVQLSHTTVRNKLVALELNQSEQRWRRLEEALKYGASGRTLSVRQRMFLQKYNPCFSAYHSALGRPFERLNLDVVKAGGGRLCIAVDPASNYAFALHLPKMDRKRFMDWLDAEVFSQTRDFELPVETVATSDLKVFDENLDGATDYDMFRELLEKYEVKRVDSHAAKPALDGSIQHVYDYLQPTLESFADASPAPAHEQAAADKLARRIAQHNRARAHPYYPSYGLSPAAMVQYYRAHGENWRGVKSLRAHLRGYISPLQTLDAKKPPPPQAKQVNSVYSSLVSLFFK